MQPPSKPAGTIMRGECVWFDDGKGYGFIRPADGSPDVYVHFSAIHSADKRRRLLPDQLVEFELGEGPKGPYAVTCRVVTA